MRLNRVEIERGLYMNINMKLMFSIRKMNYAFINKLSKNLKTLGSTASEFKMMAYLMEVPKAKTQKLAEVSMVTSGTITHVINKLIKKGFVRKIQDEHDKRIFWVKITEAGKAEFKNIHEKHMLFADGLLSGFKREEKERFIEIIELFSKGIENKG